MVLCGALRPGSNVFLGACAAALESASDPPLAFAIVHSVQRLTAGWTAAAHRLANRLQGWFIAPRPVAPRKRQQNFCCVTTRRRNLVVLRRLRRRRGALTARTFRLGVLGLGRNALASSGLPPRPLPALHLPLALGVLAVTLVPTPRLVLAPAALAQADPHPRSSPTGTAAVLWLIMTATHGSAIPKG